MLLLALLFFAFDVSVIRESNFVLLCPVCVLIRITQLVCNCIYIVTPIYIYIGEKERKEAESTKRFAKIYVCVLCPVCVLIRITQLVCNCIYI